LKFQQVFFHDAFVFPVYAHEKRLAEISSVIKENPLTPYEISQLHFGDDLDEMNSFLALSEVMGHLIYLENNNKVHRIEKEDKIFFVS
jgi:hypothetical protein